MRKTIRAWFMIGVVVLMLSGVGCSTTVQRLKARGVEFDSGKVMRVYRF